MLRDRGYQVWVCEYWNAFSRKRVDLFGIFDIIGVGNGETIAVQTTSRGNVSAREHKIAESDKIAECRKSNWRIEIHGWDKTPKTGRWRVKIVDVS